MTTEQVRILMAVDSIPEVQRILIESVDRFGRDKGARVFEALMTEAFEQIRAAS